jgi:hypothetical protein
MRLYFLLCTTWSYSRLRIRSIVQTAVVISDQIFASESRRGVDIAPRTDPYWDSHYCLAELLKLGGINDSDTRHHHTSADYLPSSLSLAGDRDSRNNKLDIIGYSEYKSVWILHIYETVVENPVEIARGMVYFISCTLCWLNERFNFWQKLKVKKVVLVKSPLKFVLFLYQNVDNVTSFFISRWQSFEHRAPTK